MPRVMTLIALVAVSIAPAAASDLAPTGTLRTVYLSSNPAQAVQDKASGEIRGASADLARELGRRNNVPVTLKGLADPPAVIDAVNKGEADIGFVAFAPERVGTVEFSQVYMLVQQSYLVLDGSPIHAIADIDRAGQTVAGTVNDSITLFMKRKFKNAKLREIPNNPAEIKRLLLAQEIDAFGANRQRLTNLMKDTQGLRMLPDNLFGVPQTIIVAKGKPEVLAAVNRFVDDMRASGFLKEAIAKSRVIGLDAAPGGSWTPKVPD
jgi:polar amino acid transport system substrate-binding protein